MATQQIDIRILGLDKILAAIGDAKTKLELVTDAPEPEHRPWQYTAIDNLIWLLERRIMLNFGYTGSAYTVRAVPTDGIRSSTFEGPIDRILQRIRTDIEKQIGGR